MKKRRIAGLLLVLTISGCAASPASGSVLPEQAESVQTEIPAETTEMNLEESNLINTASRKDHALLEAAKAAADNASRLADAVPVPLPEQMPAETALPETEDLDSADSSAAGSPDSNPGRTEYAPGFYYEPLSEEIKARIYGLSYKEDCTVPYEELRYVAVQYVDFEGADQNGEIICNKAIAQDLAEIFHELYLASYPIEKIRLIDDYNADDDLSCLENNTSSFNYRVVSGSKNLSRHALGLAIDINPFYNPYVTYPDGVERISPPGSELYADRSQDFPHKIDENDLCYRLFTAHGFTWGGHWKSLKDYQHFQKTI